MSCFKKIEYRIIPKESYGIIRNCSGCGEKRNYVNTGNFRVNANGRRIDVWLIYQCKKCRHTYNLTIMERVRPEEIPAELYQGFLANDRELAQQYGLDLTVMKQNRAEINRDSVTYEVRKIREDEGTEEKRGKEEQREEWKGQWKEKGQQEEKGQKKKRVEEVIWIENPYGIKVRTDKALAEILGISRSNVRKLEKEGKIEEVPKYIGQGIKVFRTVHAETEGE